MRQYFILLALVIGLFASTARGMLWMAQPIVVHEWGVESFDWSQGRQAGQGNIPAYMYTDAHPGAPEAMPATRVKDLPPDTGMRKKPIVYFYTGDRPGEPIPVGVELRFAEGHATSWYPQVNDYRPQTVAVAGQAPDLLAWKKNADRFSRKASAIVPDDTRVQLAWYGLTLSKKLPPYIKLPGADLPADHWAKVARDIPDADYVSNGTEAEKYLFYEGATHEQAAIAVVRGTGPNISGTQGNIVNISDHTIYNVFAIHHSGGQTWVGYVSALEPMPPSKANEPMEATVAALPLPDFSGGTVPWTDPAALHEATSARLLSALTEGGVINTNAGNLQLRDPADPQGPTTSSRLFPDEAAALEKIWRHDFFDPGKADGLTVVYRQSPAALDADMPLHLYTDIYHFFSVSRCGLVVVSNIDVQLSLQAQSDVYSAGFGPGANSIAESLAFLRQHPALAHAALNYCQRVENEPRYQKLRQMIDAP